MIQRPCAGMLALNLPIVDYQKFEAARFGRNLLQLHSRWIKSRQRPHLHAACTCQAHAPMCASRNKRTNTPQTPLLPASPPSSPWLCGNNTSPVCSVSNSLKSDILGMHTKVISVINTTSSHQFPEVPPGASCGVRIIQSMQCKLNPANFNNNTKVFTHMFTSIL